MVFHELLKTLVEFPDSDFEVLTLEGCSDRSWMSSACLDDSFFVSFSHCGRRIKFPVALQEAMPQVPPDIGYPFIETPEGGSLTPVLCPRVDLGDLSSLIRWNFLKPRSLLELFLEIRHKFETFHRQMAVQVKESRIAFETESLQENETAQFLVLSRGDDHDSKGGVSHVEISLPLDVRLNGLRAGKEAAGVGRAGTVSVVASFSINGATSPHLRVHTPSAYASIREAIERELPPWDPQGCLAAVAEETSRRAGVRVENLRKALETRRDVFKELTRVFGEPLEMEGDFSRALFFFPPEDLHLGDSPGAGGSRGREGGMENTEQEQTLVELQFPQGFPTVSPSLTVVRGGEQGSGPVEERIACESWWSSSLKAGAVAEAALMVVRNWAAKRENRTTGVRFY
uniref:BRISC and BRCA1-A complex member 2 n=1 Tax=Chromera velia CCMP2878 TaxID=1169474 RepID=A0A0G4I988_9ALVE|mmetsp:Transcript_44416/g.87790  ORF Transcript_44416/g.87790 Transcript_44416/m.87790 type:complete len:400 (-) Transcript_44416:45-1244(-)|eukprot:Cvel_12073.t1-p1 / transcript=Cvel_12073.t1 / gene=Cvel_12073 / organism=Chromera_velia_CCMP2878 / gene_product=hypothetical protein / transcript_product=hypothetical protein / location=Cvel_scaffold776:35481-44209(+) / protein_length=399 / sequence_SO=supercontig / SO=protein_coding / is_pseudo=false